MTPLLKPIWLLWALFASLCQSATNSMADTTYFGLAREAASWSSRPCNSGRCVVSYIHPNGSTHGPPTSSAVQVNLGIAGAVTDRVPANRVRAATASGYVGQVYGAN
jgi:hypothetical protein